MMRRLACAVAMLACTGAAFAEPVVTRTITTYEVRGDTPAKLRKDINAKRPLSPSGKRFDAFTTWHVKWNYSYENRGATCAMTRASTTVDIEISMPKLAARGAPKAVAEKFEGYLGRLMTHEEGHAQTGIDVAGRIEEALRETPPARTCAALEAAANERAMELIRQANARDIAYDRETRHGAMQGAFFP